jgi:hypothetical protein
LKSKILGFIASVLFLVSLWYIIGQFGALECDVITVRQFLIRTSFGILVFCLDAYLINKYYSNKNDLQERQLPTGQCIINFKCKISQIIREVKCFVCKPRCKHCGSTDLVPDDYLDICWDCARKIAERLMRI